MNIHKVSYKPKNQVQKLVQKKRFRALERQEFSESR
jgi:hypothetical protein